MNTLSDQLSSHALVSGVSETAMPTILRGFKAVRMNPDKADRIRRANNRSLTSSERYSLAVLGGLHTYLGVADRIDSATRLILIYPVQVGRGRGKMSRDAWVDYHYGCLTVALASLLDTALLLSSVVLQLGISPRHRTLDIVCSHEHVGEPVRKALRAFHKAHERHIRRRNLYLHRGERADIGELSDPDSIDRLRTLGFASQFQTDDELSASLPVFWRHALSELKPELVALQRAAAAESTRLFAALITEWTRRHATYQALETGESGG